MAFDWSKFTKESFGQLQEIIVNSRSDDYLTRGKIGTLWRDGKQIDLSLREDPDEKFKIVYRCEALNKFGEMRYRRNMTYHDFQFEFEREFEKDIV